MARLPKEKPQPLPDPWKWVADGRWAGEPRFELQSHECPRAAWFAARWATDRAPALKNARAWDFKTMRSVKLPTPPDGVDGVIAELCCPNCFHRSVCGGAPLARNCRTCRHVIADGLWRCGVDQEELSPEQQRDGCNLWEECK